MTLISKTEQSVGESAPHVAVNDTDIQAGYNDVPNSIHAAGGFLSFPATASKGSSKWYSSDNTGNFTVNHTNVAFGQSTLFKTPDPVNAAGVHMVGAGAAPFVVGNIPMATSVDGVFEDSGIVAGDYQPLTQIITLDDTQVNGAYAAPVEILSPEASTGYVLLYAAFITEVATPFADGGIAQLQFGNTVHAGGTLALATTTPAAEITAASSQVYYQTGFIDTSVIASSAISNRGIYFTNATGAFTGGAGSTVTIALQYMRVPAV